MESIPQNGAEAVELLSLLLQRGNRISVSEGRLSILPASGQPIPSEWLKERESVLLAACCSVTGRDAFFYDSFSRGEYGHHLAGGVTLQFIGQYGTSAYVIFNADIKYKRGPKKGKALPGKQFRVGKRSHFYKCWLRSGLRAPQRLQNFHDSMGLLKGIAFEGSRRHERFDAGSLTPVSIRESKLREALLPDQFQTSTRQNPDYAQTFSPDSDFGQAQSNKGFQPILTTCDFNYENKANRGCGDKGQSYTPYKIPQMQTTDEWLDDYESRVVPGHQTEPGF